MPNVTGVADIYTTGGISYLLGGGNVTAPANVETVAFRFALGAAAPSMMWGPMIWPTILFGAGATAPTNTVVAWRMQGGSDVQTIAVAQQTLPANGYLDFTTCFIGNASYNLWQTSPNIEVTVLPTGQALTLFFQFSQVAAILYHGSG